LRDWGKEYFGQRSDVDTRDYLTYRDLQIGNTISMFGRPVRIAAVDRLSRIWFGNNSKLTGFEQPEDNYRRDPPVVWPVSCCCCCGSIFGDAVQLIEPSLSQCCSSN
tara:strand:+ start:338 stop:658 length:321 start_codon:yes stop_codon:yes gene_type:complete